MLNDINGRGYDTMTKKEFDTIAIDFDGVLNKYKGYKGETELYEPLEGAKQFLSYLNLKAKNVIIYTSRDRGPVINWLYKYELAVYVKAVYQKPKAEIYIDDRAVTFNGEYGETLKKIKNFKPWWSDKE